MDRITLAARDDPKLVDAAQIPAKEARLIEMIHKALTSCGDLARYRELYRDDRKSPDEKAMAAGGHAPARNHIVFDNFDPNSHPNPNPGSQNKPAPGTTRRHSTEFVVVGKGMEQMPFFSPECQSRANQVMHRLPS
ncbi:hypothetical protein FA10DRAFT_289531 [Acaromyces ingoldii]|uniref:Uncharacterized protein n=1 Tax=Acaromyces ingoldii TaxID=215250 RepID=A0A316YBQ5_9BASI|nr:hypothetical protein FA10DRAFT_289531 [Acaromyces ingoldii]PWN86681.1 hypothetical protein FA10DRAFT_289531 [Acaromyces ingoldii]